MDISSTAQLEATQIMQVIAAGQAWVSEKMSEARRKAAQEVTA
jgi:hypothetical protein